jgi:hypothetical protein
VQKHLHASAQGESTKFQRYLDGLETRPFLELLAERLLVSESDAMRAYGLTPRTPSWPSKVSFIASKARRELLEHSIVLGRAANRKGWSLATPERKKLLQLLRK